MSEDRIQVKVDEVTGLPFDTTQQMALVGYALNNENFFKQIKDRLKSNWFTDPDVAAVYKFLQEYCDTGTYPRSKHEFDSFVLPMGLDQSKKLRYIKVADVCRLKSDLFGLDSLVRQLTDWQRLQIFLRDIPQVANLLNARPRARLDEAIQLYDKSARDVSTASFDGSKPVDWKAWKANLDSLDADVTRAMTTGLTVLDRHLLPEGVGYGSLLPGDTTLVIAPTNAGKTTFMISVARHNVDAKKDVLFISREGRELDIYQKFIQSMTLSTRQQLRLARMSPQGEQRIDHAAALLDKHLTYVHMPQVNLCVEEVIGMIISMQASKKAKTGKGYDLLVVDYPGIFQTVLTKEGRWEYRQVQDYIYRQFVQVGLEEGFHVLAAAQTNREGSRANRGDAGIKHRLLTLEDISEAFGICMSATNVITLNRSPDAMAQNRLTLYLVKSRSSETGWAVTCKSNYAACLTHSNGLGGIAVRNTATNDNVVDSLLRKYPNADITDAQLQDEWRQIEVGKMKG